MDYNTNRERLIMPEYGRGIQQMVDHCKTISDPAERMRCANTIIRVMAEFATQTADEEDFQKKLWNHLARIARYELDIDYPVEITKHDVNMEAREMVPYPQKKIRQRHYGRIIEEFTNHLAEMEDGQKRDDLSLLIANHMKRDLSNWSLDSMSDEKVVQDMTRMTSGTVRINLDDTQLVSDGELLSSRISTSVKKKKKK